MPDSDQQENKKDAFETFTEQFEVKGSQLVDRVKEVIAEGNVRRIIFRTPDDTVMMDVNLTTGAIVGGAVAVAAPWLAAIGALAALVAKVRIEVIREVKTPDVVEGQATPPAKPTNENPPTQPTTGKQKVRIEIEDE